MNQRVVILLGVFLLLSGCGKTDKKSPENTSKIQGDKALSPEERFIQRVYQYKSVSFDPEVLLCDSLLNDHMLKPTAYSENAYYDDLPVYAAYEIKHVSRLNNSLVCYLGHYDWFPRYDSIKNRQGGERKYDLEVYINYQPYDSLLTSPLCVDQENDLYYIKNKELIEMKLADKSRTIRHDLSKIENGFKPLFMRGTSLIGTRFMVKINGAISYVDPYDPEDLPKEEIFHVHNYVSLKKDGSLEMTELGEKLYEYQIGLYRILNSGKLLMLTINFLQHNDYLYYLIDPESGSYRTLNLGRNDNFIQYIASDPGGHYLFFNRWMYEKGMFQHNSTLMYSIEEDTAIQVLNRNNMAMDDTRAIIDYRIIGYNIRKGYIGSFNVLSNLNTNEEELAYVGASKKQAIISYQFNPMLELLMKKAFDEEILVPDVLKKLNEHDLWIVKNFLFAKNHYLFENNYLRAYFNTFEFYYPSPRSDFSRPGQRMDDRAYVKKKKDVQADFSHADSLNLNTVQEIMKSR